MNEHKKICEYCNREGYYSSKYSKVLCGKHYKQLQAFGCIRNTKYDLNEINEYDETIGIITRDSKYNITGEFIIDKEDYEKVNTLRKKYDFHSINDDWMLDFLIYYGEEMFKKLADFIFDENIYDLHNGNIGYLNGRPCLVDYSSYDC